MRYVIVDLETRTFDIEKGGIYQVGLVATDEEFNILEAKEISIVQNIEELYKGYGYGYRKISKKTKCIKEFKEFIKKYDATLVAHNSGFEKKFLRYYNWIDEDTVILDSITMIKRATENRLESYALDNLIEEFGIEINQRHTALDDAIATVKVLNIVGAESYTRRKSSSSSEHKELIDNIPDIKENGTNEIVNKIDASDVICFTGKGAYTRSYLTELAEKNGNTVVNTINKQVTLLVVGDLTVKSSKIVKAEEKGIKVMSADDFIKCFE